MDASGCSFEPLDDSDDENVANPRIETIDGEIHNGNRYNFGETGPEPILKFKYTKDHFKDKQSKICYRIQGSTDRVCTGYFVPS